MSKEVRMSMSIQEINVLNDWLNRMKYNVKHVELRQNFEPNIGQAITAYVETDNDEGYFRLLTVGEDLAAEARHRVLQQSLDKISEDLASNNSRNPSKSAEPKTKSKIKDANV